MLWIRCVNIFYFYICTHEHIYGVMGSLLGYTGRCVFCYIIRVWFVVQFTPYTKWWYVHELVCQTCMYLKQTLYDDYRLSSFISARKILSYKTFFIYSIHNSVEEPLIEGTQRSHRVKITTHVSRYSNPMGDLFRFVLLSPSCGEYATKK